MVRQPKLHKNTLRISSVSALYIKKKCCNNNSQLKCTATWLKPAADAIVEKLDYDHWTCPGRRQPDRNISMSEYCTLGCKLTYMLLISVNMNWPSGITEMTWDIVDPVGYA